MTDYPNFVRFTERACRNHSDKPTVTIYKGGVARFNATAQRQFGLHTWRHVEFYFDAAQRAIGFCHVPAETDSSRKMGHRTASAVVCCKMFCRHIGLTETIRLPLARDEGTDFLTAALPPEAGDVQAE